MTTVTTTCWAVMPSPVGDLLVHADDGAVTSIRFAPFQRPHGLVTSVADGHRLLRTARDQLDAYFAGDLCEFDLPVRPAGTAFQQRVWGALREIPYGSTIGYGALARRLGLPTTAARAVGLANGANPVPIVIPCHRVVGSDGSLIGYGGGLDRKRLLLDLEAQQLFRL